MSNLSLSLVAGYSVDSPALSKPTQITAKPFARMVERLSAALYAGEQRRRDADIARMIADNGGVMTDELERQISRRVGV